MTFVRALRLVAKVHAFEVVLVLVATAAVSMVLASLITRIWSLGLPLECWSLARVEAPLPAACDAFVTHNALAEGEARLAYAAAKVLAIVIGALLGASLVSQEIEQRSTYLSWALDPGRTRWTALHLAAALGLTVVLTAVVAQLGDLLQAARRPYVPASATFDAFGQRGLLIVSQGLVAAAFGALWAGVTGRALPGLALGLASAALLVTGSTLWLDKLGRLEPISSGAAAFDALILEFRYRDRTTGTIETKAQVRARSPHELDSNEYYRWFSENFTPVAYGYPGTAYPEIVLREALIEGGVAAIGVAAATIVVRRRPIP